MIGDEHASDQRLLDRVKAFARPKQLLASLVAGERDRWNDGDRAGAIGYGIFDVASILIPFSKLSKGDRLTVAAEGAGRGLSSVDDVLGGLSKGRQPSVRTVGSDRELQGVYDDLARGGSPIEVPGYKGTWVERPDGVRIGLRDVSKSGGRTIDVRLPDGTIFKVHIG